MGSESLMDMKYRSLARLFHADRSVDSFNNHAALARQRLEADSTFRTGVITPLGELFSATPRETTLLMENILLAERRISRLWNLIPGVMRWDYIRHSISEELFATNEMEGVRSTRKETQDAVDAADKAGRRRLQGAVQRICQAVPEPHGQGLRVADRHRRHPRHL